MTGWEKLVWETNEGKRCRERGGDGGMGEVCRGAHKSLYKGSVADANSLKLNKIMRGTKQWRTTLTGRSDGDF